MAHTLLVVDDDPELRTLLHDYFRERGYAVLLAADGAAMRDCLHRQPVDLVILDLMLPGEDGLSLCRDLRASSRIPVLMLTARGDDTDRIVGLEMGADDYLHKPFIPRELLARVRNILRRAEVGSDAQPPRPARRLRFAGWTLDLEARHLVGPDEVVVPLSYGEFRLLRTLAENPNRVLSREHLLDAFSDRPLNPSDRTVDVMISRLRRRMRDDAAEAELIRTVRSEGYLLSAAVEAIA
ncbi:MAG: response regulator [Burkholderiaceae bacterium]